MDRQELKKKILEIVPRDKLIYSKRTISKKQPYLYSEILDHTEYLNGDQTFSERLYHIISDLFDIVKCKLCDNQVRFNSFNYGYCTYCSIGCGKKDPYVEEKYKQTCLKKYGVDNPSKSMIVKEKIKQTCLKKYGVDNPLKTEEVKEKFKQTCLDKYDVEYPSKTEEVKEKTKQTYLNKYGVDHPFKTKEVREKFKQTCLKNYGADHPFKIESVKEKFKQTCLDRYGVDSPLKSKLVKEKIKQTCLDRYGVDHSFKIESVKEKIKQTCLDKYGDEHPSKTEEVKEKSKETCLKNYGVEYSMQSEEIRQKSKETCLKKYGVDIPLKSKEIRQKSKETCLDKYGVDYPLQSKEIKEKFKQTCLDKYRVDNPSKSEEVKEKKKQTCLANYGVDNPLKSEEIRKKISKTNKEKFDKQLEKYLIENELELVDDYLHAHNKQMWKCLECNQTFDQIWNYIQQGYRCPNCFPVSASTSRPEIEILEFIKEILPAEKVVSGSREIIPPKELDIYIPSKKIAIEFNGLYWHSYEMGIDSKYHLNKTEECEKQGIQLVHIFEDEWIFKKEIVKSRLSNLLGANIPNKIHARKCIIQEIVPRTKNQFLEENHIQGKDNSSIKLGAFYQDELISVMTFSKGNISKGSKVIEGVWELNRFCSKLNYHIPGIAGKLLSHFKKNYKWKELFSYADRRWSQGNLYERLGFNLEHITKPNYWYTKGFKRIHRFSLRKRSGEPKEIPEWLLRQQEGYLKIFDCGNLKYITKN